MVSLRRTETSVLLVDSTPSLASTLGHSELPCCDKEPREGPPAKRQGGTEALVPLGPKELSPANKHMGSDADHSPAEPGGGQSLADTLLATYELTLKHRAQ